MATDTTTALATRKQLKAYFKNGRIPDETNFAQLIDAMVHKDDPRPACPPPPSPPPPSPPEVLPAGLRLGRFDPAGKAARRLLHAHELVSGCSAPADGAWHPVITGLNDCYAFEIVACASGLVSSGWHAVTHAIALTSFARRASVNQSFSAGPLERRWWQRLLAFLLRRREKNRVQFAWHLDGATLSLMVRTNCDFGPDEQGLPARIEYHVTRLW